MRKGFGFHDRHSPFRFDPATLFIGGAVKGAYYDPSNITTLFQDNAGTTPVTAVEQSVGRILDLSGNGNHATQSAAASRPKLSARVNLLTNTENLNAANWLTTAAFTSITGGHTDPFGGTKAFKLVGASKNIYQPTATVNGFNYTMLFYVRADTNGTVRLVNAGGGASSLINVTTEWQPFTLAFNAVGTNDGPAIVTNGTLSTVYVAFPDSRFTVDRTGRPIYQRVDTATNYNTAGFPLYLAFDGSNDSMLTSSIDFTSTNKMTVWAGVTKNSDAAQGVVAELSATIASNNGAFLLSAPNSAAANYNWSSKGTTQVDNTVTTYAAPNTSVLTGQANIAGPSNIIRVNGAQAGSVATTQGTGNFGNYPLYIGRRNNATLPFNGRLYGLIVLGAAASDWQVYVTEQWMAGKTGLQF